MDVPSNNSLYEGIGDDFGFSPKFFMIHLYIKNQCNHIMFLGK